MSLLLVGVLVTGAITGAGHTAPDDGEPVPYERRLPGADREELDATVVVDARTVQPIDGVVLVDGTLHPFTEGHLPVRGIPAGPHAVVVSPDVGRGVLWRYASIEGERRTKRIALPAFR